MTTPTSIKQRRFLNSDGTLNVGQLRSEFPVLKRQIRNKKLTYLDSGATALKPRAVIDVVMQYLESGTANIHRGVHLLSEEATSAYEGARSSVQLFLNAASSDEIIFTAGTTFGINLVAYSFVEPLVKAGDEILITTLEHHANIVPWQLLCKRTGSLLKVAPIQDDGTLLLEDVKKCITGKTKFISATWVANAVGVVTPIKEMCALAKSLGIPILIDAAQAAAHRAIDVQDLDCDFLVFSGHKTLAMPGSGVLYGKSNRLASMGPFLGGGDMIKEVSFEGTTFADPPARFEAGTPGIVECISLGRACDFLRLEIGFDAIERYEHGLMAKAQAALQEVNGLNFVGAGRGIPIFSFNLPGIHAHDVGSIVDQYGVAVRTGHHCAQPLLKRLGVSSTVRACFSFINDDADIEALVHALWRAREIFA
jgi:cysteine desulfurase / selenocysteine lyase